MRINILNFSLWIFLALFSELSLAKTYYVDFSGGSDENDGLSTVKPFKHSPGDSQATSVPSQLSLVDGDTVIFKGGVKYRGTVKVGFSGIVLDGNSSGTFGKGKAIIDGSEQLSGWSPCSLNQVSVKLFCTKLPTNAKPLALNLYEGLSKSVMARIPTPTDYYETDNLDEFFSAAPANISPGTISDSQNLGGLDGGASSAMINIWGGSNRLFLKKISKLGSGAVSFDAVPTYTDRPTRYSIVNHPAALDKPGEYYVDMEKGVLYLYPQNATSLTTATYSARGNGFVIQGNNVTVRNFIIQNVAGAPDDQISGIAIYVGGKGLGNYVSGVTVEENEIRFNSSAERKGAVSADVTQGLTVKGNSIHHNLPNRGVLVTRSDTATVVNNKVEKVGGTGISFLGVTNGKITNNQVINIAGVHANGITMYLGSDNSQAVNNYVNIDGVALTMQDSNNLVVGHNTLVTQKDAYTIAAWPPTKNYTGSSGLCVHNNAIVNKFKKSLFVDKNSLSGLAVGNNIIDGTVFNVAGLKVSNNVYTTLSFLQSAKYGWKLSDTEYIQPKADVYVAPDKGDFRLNQTSIDKFSKGALICGAGVATYIGPSAKYYSSSSVMQTTSTNR